MLKLLKSNYIFLTLLFVTFITYANIVTNQLFYDDEELIYQNSYVKDLRNFPKYFTQNMIAGAGKTSNMYRPILLTSFAIDYAIWKNSPLGYHLTSIILHAVNAILIFIFINWLFKNKLLTALTSLLFIIHPVQTEAIAYASGRTDPLYLFFGLSSLLLFISLFKKGRYFIPRYIFSILLFILSLLSKETAIIFPALFILIFFTQKEYKITFKKLLLLLLPFILLIIIYVSLRLTILNFANTLNFYKGNNIYSQNLFVRMMTLCAAFFQYLSVLIFPYDLIFARNVPIITSPLNFWVIAFIFATSLLLIFSLVFWKKNKIFLFSLLWFFITLLPVAGIIPINSILAEHYLYLPSVSFFLLTSALFVYLWQKYQKNNNRLLLLFSASLICLSLFIRTVIRNIDWHDPITFYTKSLAQTPGHIPMRHNLAMAYAEKGDITRAIMEYRQIIEIDDIYPNTHHNLANIYKALGEYKKAEAEYKKALEMDPNFRFSYLGLLDLYQKTGEKEKLTEIETKIGKNK
jgi:tetratricopeptide (TPR) repeat protein